MKRCLWVSICLVLAVFQFYSMLLLGADPKDASRKEVWEVTGIMLGAVFLTAGFLVFSGSARSQRKT
jgi:preprotein translocase subunit SecE